MDLTAEQRKIVSDILATFLPECEVQLFGSRATGRSKPHSDLDLVIMSEELLPVSTIRKLRDAFDDSDLPFQVDLVEWAGTSAEFRRVIEKTAMALSERGKGSSRSIKGQ